MSSFVAPTPGFLMPPPISGSQQEFLARNKPAKTQVQRPASSSLLCIDSEDRFNDYVAKRKANYTDYNGSPYDFQITKKESMMSGFMTRLGVTEVVFPWIIPNINLYTNTIYFKWKIGAGGTENKVIIAINSAFYTPAQLAATLQVAVRATTPIATFTMTYGQTNTPNFEYAGAPGTPGTFVAWEPLPYNTALYPFGSQTKQLFDLLGFTDSPTGAGNSDLQDAETAANVVLVSGNPYLFGADTFCQSIRYIDIVCSQLTYNQGLKDTMSQQVARDTLCRLYVANDGSIEPIAEPEDPSFAPVGTFPFTIHRQFSTPKMIQWTPNQPVPGGLRFEVFDDAGNNLVGANIQIQQLSDWSMTLLVTEN